VADRVAQAGFSGRTILVDDPDSWPRTSAGAGSEADSGSDVYVQAGSDSVSTAGSGSVGLGAAAYVVFTSGSTGRPKGVV
ncbi:hypothetical protein, partial [Frankia sp. ACN10a]